MADRVWGVGLRNFTVMVAEYAPLATWLREAAQQALADDDAAAPALSAQVATLKAERTTTQSVCDQIVQRVAELPDRTSPDDWLEAMLVTADELKEILNELLPAPVALKAERTTLKDLITQWRSSADWMIGSTQPNEWQRGGSGYLRKCADELEAALKKGA